MADALDGHPTVRSLELGRDNNFHEEGVSSALARLIRTAPLKHLQIEEFHYSAPPFSIEWIYEVCAALRKSPTLESLHLEHFPPEDVIVQTVLHMPALTTIIEPHPDLIIDLAHLRPRITEVHLARWNRGEVLSALRYFPELRTVRIREWASQNASDFLKPLVELVETSATLKELDVAATLMNAKQVTRLIKAIDKGGSVERLNILDGADIPLALVRALKKLPQTHATLREIT